MTATMETETEAQTITFESKGTHLRLIRVDAVQGITPQGGTYDVSAAVNIDFEPNGICQFQVGEQPIADGPVRMEDGRPVYNPITKQAERESQDAISWLLNHREFGVQFWVKGLAPGTPLPREGEVLEKALDALVTLNAVTLGRIRESEIMSHARPVVLASVDSMIMRVEAARAEMGDDAPVEDEDVPLPSWNTPADLVKRPVNSSEQDRYAAEAAALAQPDDPRYGGGVR